MTKHERTKTWIFAIAFTLMGLLTLAAGSENGLYGLFFLLIAAFDWYRLIKYYTRKSRR